MFIEPPPLTPEGQELFDEDIADLGYVMNTSRLWAYDPALNNALFALMRGTADAGGLTLRQRGILVTAFTPVFGDSYCALSWGSKLAEETSEELAAAVLRADDTGLTDPERALAVWARKVARSPSDTVAADVQELRDTGFTDAEIFAITAFVALRIAFATVNDALGLHPDAELHTAPPRVREAVMGGRPIADPA